MIAALHILKAIADIAMFCILARAVSSSPGLGPIFTAGLLSPCISIFSPETLSL